MPGRTYHCFQLHCIWHYYTYRNQLLCFHVLDWSVRASHTSGPLSILTKCSSWSMLMHWALAVTNACNGLRYVTRFSCDIFGFYVAFIYLQKGIQVLTNQGSGAAFYLSAMVALLVLGFGYLCGTVGSSSLFHHYIRMIFKDYGTPLMVIFFTGFVHMGRMTAVTLETLPTTIAFEPTSDRGWFIHFWEIKGLDVFLAIPFAILLTILFYFDHNGKPFTDRS